MSDMQEFLTKILGPSADNLAYWDLTKGEDSIQLDGWFSSRELRAFADLMDHFRSNRTIPQIVNQVMQEIPDEYVGQFKSVLSSMSYSAPKRLPYWFEQFQEVFNEVIPEKPTEEWQAKAISALTKQPLESIKIYPKEDNIHV